MISGDSSKDPFLELNEYGPFTLSDKSDFVALSALVIAFMRYLNDNTEKHEDDEADHESELDEFLNELLNDPKDPDDPDDPDDCYHGVQ